MGLLEAQTDFIAVSLGSDKLNIELLEGCLHEKSRYQERLYRMYYGYAMSVCLRYSETEEDAVEILNDGFLKIFKSIHQYQPENSFKAWVRRIMVNTAIDHYRKYQSPVKVLDIENIAHEPSSNEIYANIAKEDIMQMVQALPPSYRIVFNLYVVEGYAHKEIAEMLGITESTSRSNLTAANAKLRALLRKRYANALLGDE